jgi:hypothetical protein
VDDLDGIDLVDEVPPEEGPPETPFPCGAVVRGERLGHCPGCYGGFDGCCRTFYGIRAWDKHHVISRSTGTRRCHSEAELVRMGMVKDGPAGSWRYPSTPIDKADA